jgi:membrane protease subunit HflC
MKAQKILLPIIAVIGALVFFSVFIVKEVNQQLFFNLVILKKLLLNQV